SPLCRRAAPKQSVTGHSGCEAGQGHQSARGDPSVRFTKTSRTRQGPSLDGPRPSTVIGRGTGLVPPNLKPVSRLVDDVPGKVTSPESDGDHLIGFCAPRRSDFDAFAGALADQRARQRRGDRQSTLADVCFVFADDLKSLFLVGLLIGEGYPRSELD